MISNCYDYYFKTSSERFFGTRIDWRWIKAMALAESYLNPEALSPVGAIGVMQLMPKTAWSMAVKQGIANDLHIPHVNIELGTAYAYSCWSIWMDEVGIERIRFMLASYNAGPGHIIKAQRAVMKLGARGDRWETVAPALAKITGRHAAETLFYVAKVETFFTNLSKDEEQT